MECVFDVMWLCSINSFFQIFIDVNVSVSVVHKTNQVVQQSTNAGNQNPNHNQQMHHISKSKKIKITKKLKQYTHKIKIEP
jgi:hypothetical protein